MVKRILSFDLRVQVPDREHALKKQQGTDALLDLFEKHKHPWLFDAKRTSYLPEP